MMALLSFFICFSVDRTFVASFLFLYQNEADVIFCVTSGKVFTDAKAVYGVEKISPVIKTAERIFINRDFVFI